MKRRLVSMMALLVVAGCGGEETRPPPKHARAPAARELEADPPDNDEAPAVSVEPLAKMQWPRVDMAKQLGGVRLGASFREFVEVCERAGGEVIPMTKTTLACSVAPVRVVFAGWVFATFCGPEETVCEVGYSVSGDVDRRDEQLEELFGMLSEKYGPPQRADGHDAPGQSCMHGAPSRYKRGWFFGPGQAPGRSVGWARLAFDCDLRARVPVNALTLFYSDRYGVEMRSKEREELNANY